MCSCPLMPRPTETMRSACERSTACSRFRERRLGLLADRGGVDRHRRARAIGAGAAPRCRRVGAERADLERDEVRRRAGGRDVGAQLALEHRPREDRPSSCRLTRDDVGDERRARGAPRAPARSRASGRCAAGRRAPALLRAITRCERRDVAVGRVVAPARRVDDDDLLDRRGGELAARLAPTPAPSTATRIGPPACCAAAIGFPRRAVQRAVALLGDHQNHHDHPRVVAQLRDQRPARPRPRRRRSSASSSPSPAA